MSHPVDTHVGKRLRQFRKERRVSQAVLGDHLGLTFQQVQKYERGTNRISASKLYDAAAYLGVPIESFFAGLPHGASDPDTPLLLERLVRVFASATEEQREQLMRLAEVVAETSAKG